MSAVVKPAIGMFVTECMAGWIVQEHRGVWDHRGKSRHQANLLVGTENVFVGYFGTPGDAEKAVRERLDERG